MLIHGKERGFALTVGASAEIADLCPDGDLKRLGEVLDGKYGEMLRSTAKIIVAMSRGYEDGKAFEDPGYKPDPLTDREVLSLTTEDFRRLQSEAMDAFQAGHKTTVETEPEKKTAAE